MGPKKKKNSSGLVFWLYNKDTKGYVMKAHNSPDSTIKN